MAHHGAEVALSFAIEDRLAGEGRIPADISALAFALDFNRTLVTKPMHASALPGSSA